jgi:transposase
VITIGIDPHKRSLTATALDPHSRLVGQLRLPVTRQTAPQLLAWAASWPKRQWAVEGATGLGRGIAQLLVAADQTVVDVPAKLAARARLLGAGNARKTDRIDAASTVIGSGRRPPQPPAATGCRRGPDRDLAAAVGSP